MEIRTVRCRKEKTKHIVVTSENRLHACSSRQGTELVRINYFCWGLKSQLQDSTTEWFITKKANDLFQ